MHAPRWGTAILGPRIDLTIGLRARARAPRLAVMHGEHTQSQTPQLREGEVFGDHRIEGILGQGGMGVVYRATDMRLNRAVALKVIKPELSADDDFRRRFRRES